MDPHGDRRCVFTTIVHIDPAFDTGGNEGGLDVGHDVKGIPQE